MPEKPLKNGPVLCVELGNFVEPDPGPWASPPVDVLDPLVTLHQRQRKAGTSCPKRESPALSIVNGHLFLAHIPSVSESSLPDLSDLLLDSGGC